MGKTGVAYNRSLSVERKYSTGEYMPGYPKVYEICDAFGRYDAITPDRLKSLSEYAYSRRATDFEEYVREMENLATLNLSNQALSYMPDYCPIGDDLDIIMTVVVDTGGAVTDKVTAFFSIYDKQFGASHHTAIGNTVVCTTNDTSGDFAFAGWAILAPGFPIVSHEKTYEFEIMGNTTLIAKWTRESVIQFVLTAGDNVNSVTGAGKYAYNALVTADAELRDGAVFSGWYRNGVLVSTAQRYSFNILEYTELEARASTGTEAYELSVGKNLVVIPGQGSGMGELIYLTSLKNGELMPVTYSADSDWITIVPNPQDRWFTLYIGENGTGSARNGIVTVTQNESGKKAYVNVQQQMVAPDVAYEWVLNDSELKEAIRRRQIQAGALYSSVRSWSPKNPYYLDPGICTESDYVNHVQHMKSTYTAEVLYTVNSSPGRLAQYSETVEIWFDPVMKS
ncbi:MAG: hypothetical protein LBK96_03075 [Prevotellaceae bacterium]|jgi:hypothetical protein|nr:hypothetical protein [Prevotellaceae bacterium]